MANAYASLLAAGKSIDQSDALARHGIFSDDDPNNTIDQYEAVRSNVMALLKNTYEMLS